jgi:peptidyl-dipeptidase A
MSDVRDLLTTAEAELAPLEQRSNLAGWAVAQEASEQREQELVDASLAFDLALADEQRYRALCAVAGDGVGLDPIARRQVALLRAVSESRQRPRDLAERIVRLEASLESLYSSHRGTIDGREVSSNEIDEILRGSTDLALRRAAWDAAKSIGPQVAPPVRELARLRNEAAQRLGHRDYFAMSLALDELDETWLLGLLDRLTDLLGDTWRREKAAIDAERRSLLGLSAAEALRPWHYADPFFQDAPRPPDDALEAQLAGLDPLAACRAYFDALGDPVQEVLDRSDLFPRARKNQHAFCMHVDRGGDVRVLANIVPGERWLGTMLHELGHAVYDVAIDRSLPWLLRQQSHIFTTEAIAMLHGRGTRSAAFLTRFAGLEEAAAADPLHPAVTRRELHVFVPWVQVMTRFERTLYADPDADLGRVWWDLVERYQGVTRPDGERPDDWATKLHVALAPVYYQNYLLGEITASQLEATLERETGHASPAGAPAEAGRLLRERFMQPGASVRWDELIEQTTSRPLSADDFARQLGAVQG